MTDSQKETINQEYLELSKKFLHSLTKGVRNIFLLWLLNKERMHGYAIVEKINDGCDYLGEKIVHGSTIYPLLHSLEKDGLIESIEEYNGKNKVKSYQTTEKGVQVLNLIKQFIKSRPKSDTWIMYLDEMIFDEQQFEYKEVNK